MIFTLIVCAALLAVAVFLGWRNALVYRERVRWIFSAPELQVGDPEFYQKLAIRGQWHQIHDAVSYDEMVLKFWIPINYWEHIARRRIAVGREWDAT